MSSYGAGWSSELISPPPRSSPHRSQRMFRYTLIMLAAILPAMGVRADDPPHLSAEAALGKLLFFDATLSNPVGQSCASCHAPAAGFTFPGSQVNQQLGIPPGVVPGRFVSRAAPQVSYAQFNLPGPPHFDSTLGVFRGGQFWDGHAPDLVEQAKLPFVSPNEMNNLTHNIPDPARVVYKVAHGPHAQKFRSVFGAGIFSQPTEVVYHDIAHAIAEYEKSDQVSPFSSKYDAWLAGRAELTPKELNGLRLVSGTWTGRPDGAVWPRFAHCVECHMIPSIPAGGPDIWTLTCYQNIGVPRNPNNPFYTQTDPISNPVGYNPEGEDFVDIGLGEVFYPMIGLPPGNMGVGSNGLGDFAGVNGTFKAPSLRNVDLRPHPGFVKAYMHNGVFKSLEQVVHFYNTRNLTTRRGEVIDFTRADPYAGLRGRPLWDPPEYGALDTLLNPEGALGTEPGTGPGGESTAQVGNLGITLEEERDIVAFLKTLSDGYFHPQTPACMAISHQPVSQRVCRGGSAMTTVAANHPGGNPSYQWRHNGVPIPGENHSFYTIVAAAPSDAGLYDCVLTLPCGTVTSRAATIMVCLADFDCDGKVDFGDFQAFLAAFRSGQATADVNGDGVVNVLDVHAFVEALRGGC